MTDTPSKLSTKYSPFWPLAILVTVLLFNFLLGTWGVYQQRKQLRASAVEIRGMIGNAKRITSITSGLVNDLLTLAPSSPSAQLIVEEFRIQSNASAGKEDAKKGLK